MSLETHARINLTALQRRDPYISQILDSATHVAVYTFNPVSGDWGKTEIEGTLFVYSRMAPPLAGFTIMNQLSMKNFTEPLNSDLEFQNQSPFLLYKNSKMLIYGIWFYDMYDCSRIGDLFVELCKGSIKVPSSQTVETGITPLPPSPISTSSSSALSMYDAIEEDIPATSSRNDENTITSSSTGNSSQPIDIMEILSKAQKDYHQTNSKQIEEKGKPKSRITKAELFKPVPIKSDSKKVNIATLFEQTELNKSSQINRPLSANNLNESKSAEQLSSSKPQSIQSRNHRNSRSMSFSVNNEQSRTNIVNGAISVEELESPVLGMPARRTRFASVNDAAMQTLHMSNSATSDCNGAFQKLFNKVNNMSVNDSKYKINPLQSTTSIDRNNSVTSASRLPDHGSQAMKVFKRSMSTPGGLATINPQFTAAPMPEVTSRVPSTKLSSSVSSCASFTSLLTSLPTSAMPTLHEQVGSQHPALQSNSNSLYYITSSSIPKNSSFPLAAALHGSAKDKEVVNLLSPSVLNQVKKSYDESLQPNTHSLPTNLPTAAVDIPKSSLESKTLISPEDFEQSSVTPLKAMQLQERLLSNKTNEIKALTKDQLANTLISLLQTDSTFVEVIHKAYLVGLSPNLNPSNTNELSDFWK